MNSKDKVCLVKTICVFLVFSYNVRVFRGVAQPGRVLAWGARGRRFESRHPDHKNYNRPCADFNFYQWVYRFDTLQRSCQARAAAPA